MTHSLYLNLSNDDANIKQIERSIQVTCNFQTIQTIYESIIDI